jgi:hypothetical protein
MIYVTHEGITSQQKADAISEAHGALGCSLPTSSTTEDLSL